MSMTQKQIQDFSHSIISKLKKLGASDAEVFAYSGTAREVVMREGEIEKAENATGNTVSVRAYDGKRSAAANFSFDADADLSVELGELIGAAKLSPEDPYSGLADPSQLLKAPEIELDIYDETPLLSINELRHRATILEKSASGQDVTVDQADSYHSKGAYFYTASNGFEDFKRISHAGQSVVAIHQGKELTRDYASSSKTHLADLENLEATGKRAFERTWAGRNPVRGASGIFPVLFDERVSSSLIGHLLNAMSAGAIARRASWLIDYEEGIFPQTWSILETPHRKRMGSSQIYDAEGMVKTEQKLVENRRPNLWISNLSTARQLDLQTSGHATRSGVNTGAGVRSWKVLGETIPRETLLKDMDEGLLITGFIGATLNPHTGDYSRGANGFWIKNGEIEKAVNEVTIASNLKDMLPKLRAADDADETKSNVVGSLLVEEMTIAGS